MTREQKIQAAKDMTEANIEHHRIHLEEGYVEASAKEMYDMGVDHASRVMDRLASLQMDEYPEQYLEKRIWAIDQNGVFTTEF